MPRTKPIGGPAQTNVLNFPDGTLRALASTLVSRAALQASLGKSYDSQRDIYVALGYRKNPQFEDYFNRYDRQDVAKRVVTAYPQACWRKKPDITESVEDETPFEKRWLEIVDDHKVWHYLRRADILSGIGRFGVLFIGFDDVQKEEDLLEQVTGAKEITYLKPIMENNVEIKTYEKDPSSPRYGMPLLYSLTTYPAGEEASKVLVVHHSRIIHLAEDVQQGDLYGTPRLRPVLNRLQDLELVSGGSAEMFWRGAFPGFNFSVDKDYDASQPALDLLKDEIDDYVHNIKRYMRTQGVTAESLSQQVADPSQHADLFLKLISGATGIPVRILTGSERGELASSQDESNWNDRVDERRTDYVEPFILRPFINRLIEAGVMPEPVDGYTVDWPDIDIPSEKEEADTAKVRTETLTAYANSMGADIIVTPKMFLKKFMGFTDEDISQMGEALGNELDFDQGVEDAELEKEQKDDAKFEKRAAITAKHTQRPALPTVHTSKRTR